MQRGMYTAEDWNTVAIRQAAELVDALASLRGDASDHFLCKAHQNLKLADD